MDLALKYHSRGPIVQGDQFKGTSCPGTSCQGTSRQGTSCQGTSCPGTPNKEWVNKQLKQKVLPLRSVQQLTFRSNYSSSENGWLLSAPLIPECACIVLNAFHIHNIFFIGMTLCSIHYAFVFIHSQKLYEFGCVYCVRCILYTVDYG